MHDDTPSYQFRGLGFLLAMVFHVVMFAWAFMSKNPLDGGFRFMFAWYMPSIVLGLPWSIAAMFTEVIVPGLGLLGVATSVCLNGYLLGWLIDAIVSYSRRSQQRRVRESYRGTVLTMDQLRAAEAASMTNG